MYKCVHGFAPKLLCDMIVMASDVNVTLEIQIHLMFIYQSLILNATGNLLNMQVVRYGMIYLIIYRMHHQWRHLNMPVRNLILNTGTLNDESNVS